MLEGLAILAIITVIAILWLAGSLFAAIFLTLCALCLAFVGFAFAMAGAASFGSTMILLCVGLLAIVWAPRLCQRRPRAPGHAYRG